MKKAVSFLLALCLFSTYVFASDISVKLNGSAVEFTSQKPIIIEGRTFILVRGIFEKLGYNVAWDNTTKTAAFTNGSNIIEVTADSETFNINGNKRPLEVPARIINGSMLLPLRAVGEAAGLTVDWDSSTKTVYLTSSSSAQITSSMQQAYLNYANENNIEHASNFEYLDSVCGDFMSGFPVNVMNGEVKSTEYCYYVYPILYDLNDKLSLMSTSTFDELAKILIEKGIISNEEYSGMTSAEKEAIIKQFKSMITIAIDSITQNTETIFPGIYQTFSGSSLGNSLYLVKESIMSQDDIDILKNLNYSFYENSVIQSLFELYGLDYNDYVPDTGYKMILKNSSNKEITLLFYKLNNEWKVYFS